MAAIKAREIIEKLQGNHDPKLINILCAMAERDEINHRQAIQLAEAYDRLVNMFSRVLRGVSGVKDQSDKLLARMGMTDVTAQVKSIGEEDDDPNSTLNVGKKN